MDELDLVFMKQLRTRCIIGVYEHERVKEQEVLIDIYLYTDTRKAESTDRIEDCIDYNETAQEIKKFVKSASRYTLEALAGDIARICLDLDKVKKVRVRLEKPGVVPFLEAVGVEITRKKNDDPG